MSIYDEIYETAFEDELQKIAAEKGRFTTVEELVGVAPAMAGLYTKGPVGMLAGYAVGVPIAADMRRRREGKDLRYTPAVAGGVAGGVYGHMRTRKIHRPLFEPLEEAASMARHRNRNAKIVGAILGAGAAGLGHAAYKSMKNKAKED